METWLSPFCSVWKAQFPAAAVPFKQLARVLKPLLEAHDTDRIVRELAGYLKQTPAQFLNLHKFAATFGSWGERRAAARPYFQSVDEMDRNAGILP